MIPTINSLCYLIPVIFLILLLPSTISKKVEFGIQLKEFRGKQNILYFGFADLSSYEESLKFKSLVNDCINDYFTNESRKNLNSNKNFEGLIESVEVIDGNNTELKLFLSGAVLNFYQFLIIMLRIYFHETHVKMQFFDYPFLITSTTNRIANKGEIMILEYDSVFTNYSINDDIIRNYMMQSGSMDGSSSDNSETNPSSPLLSKIRFAKKKGKTTDSSSDACCCNRCIVS